VISSRTKFRRAAFILLLATILAAITLFYFARPSAYFRDPSLVATSARDLSELYAQVRGGPAFLKPFWKTFYKLRPLKPGTTIFSPAPTNRFSIHGVLNQCHEAIDVQFFIDKQIAAGSVIFGYTNQLSAPAWTDGLTNAIISGTVEWWDQSQKAFRHDNPLFIPISDKVVLVIPTNRLAKYNN
jgi:hypothetical protein